MSEALIATPEIRREDASDGRLQESEQVEASKTAGKARQEEQEDI